jgi:uncharacterized membrane protein
MNNEGLMQHYLLRKIYENLNDTYNSINEYQLFDNSKLNDVQNFENYNLLVSIINFSKVINLDLVNLQSNEICIDNFKRKRNE